MSDDELPGIMRGGFRLPRRTARAMAAMTNAEQQQALANALRNKPTQDGGTEPAPTESTTSEDQQP
jgi:hypothetical protein